jgi:aspartyl-tRNA(Asn)/glutamyl-tRNA(Gln) amidotransferase subunit A
MNASADPQIPRGAAAAAAALARGEITALALTEAMLARIAARDPAINSFLAVTDAAARADAAASDARRAAGKALGALDGVPVAVKDNIDVAGVATTGGIGALRGRIAKGDAPAISRLKAAGAVILGKLNMHEAAHGATTANAAYGFCHNPHRPGFTPGGSSGGSGAAVAAGLCAAALGTDTLGSIRIPASFCGVAGIKPTRGLVSTRGVLPLCWALDHVGPLAPTVADLGLMLTAMAGHDGADPGSRQAPPWMTLSPGRGLSGLRLGRIPDLAAASGSAVPADIAAAYERALALLESLGATVVDADLRGYDHNALRPKAMLMIEADLAVAYADDLARDPEGFTPIFRQGVDYGRQQGAPRLAEAIRLVKSVQPLARRLFAQVDALVTPTTPVAAFAFDQPMPKTLTAFTAFANYAGCPAVSVPMGKTADGLPMGLQVVAPDWEDARALRIAAAYETAAAHDMSPP